jgi:hypothetical protein
LAFRPGILTSAILSNVATIHYMTPYDMLNSTFYLQLPHEHKLLTF